MCFLVRCNGKYTITTYKIFSLNKSKPKSDLDIITSLKEIIRLAKKMRQSRYTKFENIQEEGVKEWPGTTHWMEQFRFWFF